MNNAGGGGLHPRVRGVSRAGAEAQNNSPCLCEGVAGRRPATPSHKHGLCPPLGSQPAFLLNIAGLGRQCSAEGPAEGPKVGV